MGASEGVPVERGDVRGGGERAPGGVAVGASERVPVGRGTCSAAGGHLEVRSGRVRTIARGDEACTSGGGRAPGGVAVGASERVPVGRVDVLMRGGGRPPRGAAVGASERVRVGRGGRAQGAAERGATRCCSGRVRTGARGTRDVRRRGGERPPGGVVQCGASNGVLQWARRMTSAMSKAAAKGTRPPGGALAGHVGASRTVPVDDEQGTCSSGDGRAPGGVAVGASERVPVGRGHVLEARRGEGTWRCCSGRVRTGARGTGRRGRARRTRTCCSGRVRPVGRGARARRREATWSVAVGASERVPVGLEGRAMRGV